MYPSESRLSKKAGGYAWMYGTSIWQQRRLAQLVKQPLCELCLEHQTIVVARVAHHIHPHNGVWQAFISIPLQSLCKECHDSIVHSHEQLGFKKGVDVNGAPLDPDKFIKLKAKREPKYSIPFDIKKSGIPVVLIHGAPGSGKSTYARQAVDRSKGDLIIDFDDIYKSVGTTRYDRTAAQRKEAFKIRDRLLYSLHRRQYGTCYFIVMAPTRKERNAWCAALGAVHLHHCDIDKDTCVERIKHDASRDIIAKERSIKGIEEYFKAYTV